MALSPADEANLNQVYRDLLGYLNFSDGSPGTRFRECINALFAANVLPNSLAGIGRHLQEQLASLADSGESAFAQTTQASNAIERAFGTVPARYFA